MKTLKEILFHLQILLPCMGAAALLILFAMLFCSPAYPQGLFEVHAGTTTTHEKQLAVAFGGHVWQTPLTVMGKIGFFNYRNIRILESYAPFGQLDAGWRVHAKGVYAHVQQGVALVSPPDRAKGQHLQFPTTVSCGIQDQQGWYLGAYFTHYSNGGRASGNSFNYNGFGVVLGAAF